MPAPDGPQFNPLSLWDSAMANAQANLDAISDEDLDEAEAEATISDSISDMISASQIEETGHTQTELTDPAERAFARRNQPTYDAAEAMAESEVRGTPLMSREVHQGLIDECERIANASDEDLGLDREAHRGGSSTDQMDMAGNRFSPNYEEGADLDAYLSGVEQRQEERKAERGE